MNSSLNHASSLPSMMSAMVLEQSGMPLCRTSVATPTPGANEILIRVRACGVCRTDLHIVDGDLKQGRLPLIPGHEVVGTVEKLGASAQGFSIGDRVGIPWLGSTCGHCPFCLGGQENLCDDARFTGYHLNGGYAEYMLADAGYCFRVPERYDDVHAAPLLCAGLIGYRAYVMAGAAKRIGLYGFGAAAHIIAQVAGFQDRQVFAFTRPGDIRSRKFAYSLGVKWAGDSDAQPPAELDAAIIFAPVGALVPRALAAVRKGGRVVCAGIHMTDIPSFPYALLWGERSLQSVANLTREDGVAFFKLAEQYPLRTSPVLFALGQANEALSALRNGEFDGAAVLVPQL